MSQPSRLIAALLYSALASYVGTMLAVAGYRRGIAMEGPSTQSPVPLLGATTPTAGGIESSTPSSSNLLAIDVESENCRAAGISDIGFSTLPFLKAAEVTELWVMCALLITLVRFFFHPMSSVVIRRWALVAGTLDLFCGLAKFGTAIPSQLDESCRFVDRTSYSAAWTALLIHARQVSMCADVNFSHHAIDLTVVLLVWTTYHKRWDFRVKLLGYLYIAIGLTLAIAARTQFTADVVVWATMSVLAWGFYHAWVKLVWLDRLKVVQGQLVSQSVLRSVILWLELGAEDLCFTPVLNRPQARLLAESFEDDEEYDSAFVSDESAPILRGSSSLKPEDGQNGIYVYESFAAGLASSESNEGGFS